MLVVLGKCDLVLEVGGVLVVLLAGKCALVLLDEVGGVLVLLRAGSELVLQQSRPPLQREVQI